MGADLAGELIDRVRRGDEDACRELVAAHQPAIYRLARRMLRDAHRAEDVCQETFLRTLGRLGELDGRKPLIHYLRRVATHLCINELRRRRPTVSLDEAAGVPSRRSTEADTRDARLREAVDESVAELPVHQRVAFVLFHQEQLEYEGIAELTGRPLNTIKSDLHRARRRIGDALRAAGLAGEKMRK